MRIKKYYKLVRVDYEDEGFFYIKNTSDETGTLTINNSSYNTLNVNLKTSFNNVDWTTYDSTTSDPISILVPPNTNIYFKGNNPYFGGEYDNWNIIFNLNKPHIIGGNLMSVISEDSFSSLTEVPKYSFKNTFKNDIYLTSAEKLNFGNATSLGVEALGESDYNKGMFNGCTSLIKGIDLSNITSIGNRGCSYMYYGCSSLTKATAPNVSTWNTSNMYNWLANTAATGVVRKPAGLDIPTNNASGVPSGWTTEDY